MTERLVLASGSEIRRQLLNNAGIDFLTEPVRIDEESIRASLVSEGVPPDQIADALADAKAAKSSNRNPEDLSLGCDQILALDGKVYSKARTEEEATHHLLELQGKTHMLFSAAVIYQRGRPIWRHTGRVRLTMRTFAEAEIRSYVLRNWPTIKSSVGGYKIEEEGIRLFSHIEGDYFHILGLPLLQLIGYLTDRGSLKL